MSAATLAAGAENGMAFPVVVADPVLLTPVVCPVPWTADMSIRGFGRMTGFRLLPLEELILMLVVVADNGVCGPPVVLKRQKGLNYNPIGPESKLLQTRETPRASCLEYQARGN